MGFEACGFARAQPVNDAKGTLYHKWILSGYHGKMEYLNRNTEKRLDPRLLVPGAKTVICLAFNYHQEDFQPSDAYYRVSQYAAGIDYHHVLKKKLYQLLEYVKEFYPGASGRVFTDSAPVLERYWAQQAGLGSPGKNTCLILPRKGSYYFLAEMIVDIDLPPDAPAVKDPCGNCTRCMQACPTQAIVAPGVLDARKCTSYLTIELKDALPEDLRGNTKKYIFGCDICQQVCPHNIKFAAPCTEKDFKPLASIARWSRLDWESMDKVAWRRNFVKTGSPMARASFEKLRDNMDAAANQER